MERRPTYPIREATSFILACKSIEEIETIKNLLISDLNSYPFADQGFLMAMIGFQIMKTEDGHENLDRLFRGCIFASIMRSNDN